MINTGTPAQYWQISAHGMKYTLYIPCTTQRVLGWTQCSTAPSVHHLPGRPDRGHTQPVRSPPTRPAHAKKPVDLVWLCSVSDVCSSGGTGREGCCCCCCWAVRTPAAAGGLPASCTGCAPHCPSDARGCNTDVGRCATCAFISPRAASVSDRLRGGKMSGPCADGWLPWSWGPSAPASARRCCCRCCCSACSAPSRISARLGGATPCTAVPPA